jgi:hypothetical protein
MRIESSVTSVSWIPSEAITGSTKLPFEHGMAHYDQPLPEHIDDLAALQAADRFRFANELRAWIDVEDGKIVDSGYSGHGRIGSTTVRLGGREMTFTAFALPDLRIEPEVGDGRVRFQQTAGGRTGMPAPRRVNHPPFVQFEAPFAWTTLSLTLHADGTVEHGLVGASPFPRHWVYDNAGDLVEKSGLIDFKSWYRNAFGKHSPWGDADSAALVTAVETALERELSRTIMRGGEEPRIKKLAAGKTLVKQGDKGTDVFLVLDGILTVDVDGISVGSVGPGAVLGERAALEDGVRTSTLKAETKCRVAVVGHDQIDSAALAELSEGHKREKV